MLVLPIYRKGTLIKHGGCRGVLLTTWDGSKSAITLRFENGRNKYKSTNVNIFF